MNSRRRTWPYLRVSSAALAGLVLAVSILSGCMVGPDYSPAPTATSDGWIDNKNPQLKAVPPDSGAWWKVFNDPILDKLVAVAYSQNLPLRVAGLRVLEARAQRGIAVGNFFPQTQLASGSYERVRQSEQTVLSFPPYSYNQFAYGGNVSWELDVWGRFRRGIESADASLYASVLNYDALLVTLVSDVATAYMNIRAFDERIDLARSNVTIQQQALDIANARFRAGGTTELDVEQATSLLGDTQSKIPSFEIGRRQAENQLCILLGMPPRQLNDILGRAKPIPAPPPSVAIGIPAEALRRRPDVRSAERQAAAQCAQIGVAVADLYPAFSISGAFGFQSEQFGDLWSGPAFAGVVSPSFQWPLFNYGRIKNNIRVQDARFEQVMTNYQNVVLSAGREVEDAITTYLHSQEQIQYLATSVKASQRAVELAMIQYQTGGADYTRVLDSQRFLVQEQDSLVVSRTNVTLGLVTLHRALGGGWEIRQGQEFVPDEVIKRMRARTNWGDLTSPKYTRGSDMLFFPRPDTDKEPKVKITPLPARQPRKGQTAPVPPPVPAAAPAGK